MRALILLLLSALAGCATTPVPPKVVTKVVEVYRPLPAWAVDELPDARATDGTVGGFLDGYHSRGAVIDLAACHRRMLRLLDAGWPIDKDTCAHPDED